MTYHWPGNIRELEHIMEHAFVVCSGPTITSAHLPKEIMDSPPSGYPVQKNPSLLTEKDIRRALEKSGGNKAKAARLLGIGRQTLYNKIKEYKRDELK